MLFMVNMKGNQMDAMTSIILMDNDLPFEPAASRREHEHRAAEEMEHDHSAHEMRGQLTTREAIVKFMEAGNAIFTVVSKASGSRFTFKFSRPKAEGNRARPIWVAVLTGPNNDADYSFAGSIWIAATGYTFNLGKKSTLTATSPSMLALSWLLKHLNAGSDGIIRQAEFWHEGRCGRCGRTLTVPASVESGFGPECITKV
jgi:hypothetical protein